MAKIVVTGGAGFIGSHVCEALLKRGDHVACVDNFNDYYDPAIKEMNVAQMRDNSAFSLHRADITDMDAMRRVFAHERPEKVIHLAARAGVRPSIAHPLLYARVNITGTANLLELAREHTIKTFIFASSSSVYGERKDVPFKETDTVDHPISPYAATKKAGELLCHTYAHLHGLPVTCLRFFTVYGPRGRPDMAPYKFIDAAMNNRPIDMYGDGTSMRDYTYVADIVAGVLAAADKSLAYDVINLGNSNPVSLSSFITTIERVVGKRMTINRKPTQPGDVSKTYANTARAKELLSWQAATTLEQGLKSTYEWLSQKTAKPI